MATEITFRPFVDGVLTLVEIQQHHDGRVVAEQFALERDVAAEVQAALADPGNGAPELVRRREASRIRRVGWRRLSSAA